MARIKTPNIPPLNGCTCWLVSMMPPGGALPDVHKTLYFLAYFDARTGVSMGATSAGR
jgi:hypothetical protein